MPLLFLCELSLRIGGFLKKRDCLGFNKNLEVDRCPSKESLFGQYLLLINAIMLSVATVIYRFVKWSLHLESTFMKLS